MTINFFNRKTGRVSVRTCSGESLAIKLLRNAGFKETSDSGVWETNQYFAKVVIGK